MRYLLHFLLILSIISATVSPACAFIGGKNGGNFIEICAADGSLKTIPAPAGFEFPAKQPVHNVHKLCDFCILHTSLQQAAPLTTTFIPPIAIADDVRIDQAFLYFTQRPELSQLSPRAPPIHL